MKISGKLRLAFYRMFSFVTFHKYYICEDCNKIHKRTGNEFEVGRGHIYVSIDCANATINRACKALRDGMLKN